MMLNCTVCGTDFQRKTRRIRKGVSPCCSKRCSTKKAADAASARWKAINAGEQQRSGAELAQRGPCGYSEVLKRELLLLRHMAGNWFIACNVCSKRFLTRSKATGCCSAECRAEQQRRYSWEITTKGKVLECPYCGVQHCPLRGSSGAHNGNASVCSDECRSALDAKHDNHGTRLNKHKVHMTFNWTCQACGCSTPESLAGTCDDNAPEVDHIIARAVGGLDTYDNTHTLCRICNCLKSDTEWHEFLAEWFPCTVTEQTLYKSRG